MGDGDKQSREVELSSSSPHSANAEARMKFASVDVLSELVWSPRNGLSLRCADFSFTRKGKLLSPNFFDDLGQTNIEFHLRTGELLMDRTEDQVNQACSEMTRPLSGIGGSVEDMKPGREEMVEDKVETNDVIESVEAETRVESSKRSSDSPSAIGGQTEASLRSERAESQEEPTNRMDKEEEDHMKNSVLYVDRLESMDDNELKALVAYEKKGECLPEDETDVEKAGTSGSYRRRAKAKGKEKALSDGNFGVADDDHESFGSVESCNSAGLLSRGKKRPGYEQELILGSKRLKTVNQKCLGSTSKLKQDSSFMKWISNMTKGIRKGNEEDDSPFVALTTTSVANGQVNTIVDQQQLSPCCPKENTGFQSFFQSIYCPKERNEDPVEMDFPNDSIAGSLQEQQCLITNGDHLSSSSNEIGPVAEPNISSEKVGFNQTSKIFSSENKNEDKVPNTSLLSLSKSKPNEEQNTCGEAGGKVSQCLTNRNAGLESLWISRFSSNSSFPRKKDLHERMTDVAAKEANDSASGAAKICDSQKMMLENNVLIPSVSKLDVFNNPNKILPIVSSSRIESSEAMASLFAKILEAMKHIMPSVSLAENAEEGQANLLCFYCGKKGHCLRDCLEVTDTELRDLVENLNARNGREELSSLCIRCFQLSHWAATCPNARLNSSGAEDRAVNHTLASTSGTKLPLSDFTYIPKMVFEAVQALRLTRTDVLKWLKTKKSVSGLEGFFLRIRLGKWEEGIGGTGYYVACIVGAKVGESSRRHSETSSISVKVGGMICFVESQFISNHNFFEEELNAWWRSAGKSGGDGSPLVEELSRKIQERKMLGF